MIDDTAVPPSATVPPTGGTSSAPRENGLRTSVLQWLGVLVATVGWLVALGQTKVEHLTTWGLVAAFPVLWYLALAVLLAVYLLSLFGSVVRNAVMIAATVVLTWVLYGSAAFVEHVPRFDYVYKHIAVTDYIGLHGSVNTSIDIYNRWPGFFALSALFGKLTGHPDAVSYAAWAEPVFATVDVLLVVAIARIFNRNPRFYWSAALLFMLTNWIGQNYYSPQGFAFMLYLAVCLLALTTLRNPPRRLGLAVERLVARAVRAPRDQAVASSWAEAPADGADEPAERRRRAIVLGLILVLDLVIVVSHQLTPYVLLLVLLPLSFAGYLRPRWLTIVMLVMTVAYLIPNLAFIQDHFGLFSSLDPFANATFSAAPRQLKTISADTLQDRGTLLLSAAAVALLLVGLIRRARAGDVRSVVIVAWFGFAPALLLAVQSYGGEGRLRILLFALPWVAIAGTWAFWPRAEALRASHPDRAQAPQRGRRPTIIFVAVTTILAVIFVPTYFQSEFNDRVAPADVAAAQWLDRHVRPGDMVLTTGPNLPVLVGPHYNDILNTSSTVSDFAVSGKPLTVALFKNAVQSQLARSKTGRTFIILTAAQDADADAHGLYQPGALRQIRAAAAAAPGSTLVYHEPGASIYELRAG